MLFRRPVSLNVKDEYLVERHPKQDFKKGKKVSILKNQEVVLVLPDGIMEVLKNVYNYKLKERVKYLYFCTSNKSVLGTNWGTKSRVHITIQDKKKTLGGYGSIQFRLINPVRYIEKRMGNSLFVTAEMLTDLVLAKIPESLVGVVIDLKENDKKDLNSLTLKVKELLSVSLKETLAEIGIELVDLVVTNLNLQDVEE